MPQLKWTGNALRGVRKAYEFLAEHDTETAQAAVRAIRHHSLILNNFPEAGRPADDLDPEHRELLVPFGASGYVLVYEVVADHVLILAVKHQRESGY